MLKFYKMKVRKIIRIKDIAEKAGTSKGTVDRVLHNRGRVAEAVRLRVLRIVKELNYEPNLIARTLKSQKTVNIAALIPGPEFDPYWESPKLGLERAEQELRQFGVVVTQFVFNPYDVHSFVKLAEEVTSSKPDGILIAPIFHKEVMPFFHKWEKLKIPFVLFNTQIMNIIPLCYIGQDSFRSGYLAAKILDYGMHQASTVLITHIFEDIPNSAHLQAKEDGFTAYFKQDILKNKHLVVRTEITDGDETMLFNHMDGIISKHGDIAAIYVTNSKAFEIAHYLNNRNIHHIKLIGYDLLDQNLEYLNSGLIQFLINQNPHGQGYWGIHQLANFIIFKKDIQPIKFLPLDIITKENLDYYLDPI